MNKFDDVLRTGNANYFMFCVLSEQFTKGFEFYMTDYTPGGTFGLEVGLGECELLNVNSRQVEEL